MSTAAAPLRALIEATDRHGRQHLRQAVTDWPVTVGRDLGCDLVLDDVHVAARHLRLTQDAPGRVSVEVLETKNGAMLGRERHQAGSRFDWIEGAPLTLGRTQLHLRLADTPVPQEQRLSQWPWRMLLWTVATVLLTMALIAVQEWHKSTETQKFLHDYPTTLLGVPMVLGLWAGLWALAGKLFSGQLQFWRHVRIACIMILVSACVDTAVSVLAFMFSWETLSRFGNGFGLLVLAVGLHRHLLVVAPQRRRGLTLGVALLLLLGVSASLGTQWLKNKRLSNQLYMSELYPPDWRVAAPVSVPEFLREAATIEQRLALRLQDKEDEDAANPSQSDD